MGSKLRLTSSLSLLLIGALAMTVGAGCASAAASDDGSEATGSRQTEEDDELSADGASYTMTCTSEAGVAKVVVSARDGAFDIKATRGAAVLFQTAAQLASLNARVEDDASLPVAEYVDFNDKGVETVPVDGPKALEVDLSGPSGAFYAKKISYKDGAASVALDCRLSNEKLLGFLRLEAVSPADVDMTGVSAVGFDIDDTLAFTSPAFARGFAAGGTENAAFWTNTNACDVGCAESSIVLPNGTTKLLPANAASTVKASAVALIARHKARGHKVYAITARPDTNGGPVRDFIERELGIAKADVFFEPSLGAPGNPGGKTDRIEGLNLDIFYGDSDSDITDAKNAFIDAAGVRTKEVRAVRFFRSPRSLNRKAGKLNKYHPGYFGEAMIKGSY